MPTLTGLSTLTAAQSTHETRVRLASALRTQFLASDFPDKALNTWLRIPNRDECPSPSGARNWGKREWGEWAEAHGYEYQGDTSHSFRWVHVSVPCLSIGLAKTTGDCRSARNLASDVRREVAAISSQTARCFVLHAEGKVSARDYDVSTVPEATSEEEFLRTLLLVAGSRGDTLQDPGEINVASHDTSESARVGRECVSFRALGVPSAAVNQQLDMLSKEYGIAKRTALRTAMSGEAVERTIMVLKDPNARMGDDVLIAMTDLLAVKRMDEADEKERKAQERKEREKPKPKPSLRDQIQRVFDQRRLDAMAQLKRVEEAARSAVDRAVLTLQSMPTFELPADLTDPATVERITQLEEELVAAESRAYAAEEMVEAMGAQLAAAPVAPPAAAHDYRSHLAALAGLVVDTVRDASSMGPFAMVKALNALSSEAESALQTTKTEEVLIPEGASA